MRQILQWGSCAEVIAPSDFREEIAQEIEKMTKKYQRH